MWRLGCGDQKWAQTLVQDPSHHAQVLTAMFGKLPAEPSPTLGPDGEITPEANPWAARWMADLEALEPYDERGVVQRMERDVRGPLPGSGAGGRLCRNRCHGAAFRVVVNEGVSIGLQGGSRSSNGGVGGRSATVAVLLR